MKKKEYNTMIDLTTDQKSFVEAAYKPFRNEEEVPINLEQRKFWLGYIAYLGICSPKLNNCPENISQ